MPKMMLWNMYLFLDMAIILGIYVEFGGCSVIIFCLIIIIFLSFIIWGESLHMF